MAADFHISKKRKLNSNEKHIFVSFHSNKMLMDDLKTVTDFIEHPYSGYGVCLSKIQTCNAVVTKPFSKASCEAFRYKRPDKHHETNTPGPTQGYAISSIFEYGFQVLEAYFDAPYRIPLHEGAMKALSKLLTFLSQDIHQAEKALVGFSTEISQTDWTVRVAHHLISRLTVSSSYLLYRHHQGSGNDMKCTCDCNARISGCYGDTSIGVPKGWHGYTDILTDVAIQVMVSEKCDPAYPQDDESSEAWKSPEDTIESAREQLRARSIIFSLLQLRDHPELRNHLIPTVAISRDKVAIFFYDSQNDMMLETPCMDLLNDEELSKPTLVILWLVMNYKYFCSGVTDQMRNKGYTADFVTFIGQELGQYKDEVRSPCQVSAECEQFKLLKVTNCRARQIEDINQINQNPDIFS